MTTKNLVVALDIGTTKVCTTIGVQNKENFEIVGVGSYPSYGLKKGSVVNIEKTVKSIRASIDEAKLMAGVEEITNATIGIAGNHIFCFNSTGVVAVKNAEITNDDVERVLEAAKAVVIPSDREILHVIPQEFRVDKTSGIKDPVGMCGVRLEAKVHIVTGLTPLVHNLIKCVEMSGLKPEKIILQPIASSKAVLTEEEKELGVVLVDIGGGTTDIAIWKDGSLVHSQIIPVGGNHFTNDLAVALKIPHNEAENLKINNGSVVFTQNSSDEIQLNGLVGMKPRYVELALIQKVLKLRSEELFETINNVIMDSGFANEITGGIVLTGGGSLINGISEVSEYIIKKPTKIGYPISFGGMTKVMQHPKFSTVIGLLIESFNFNKVDYEEEAIEVKSSEKDIVAKLGDSIKNVFRDIF